MEYGIINEFTIENGVLLKTQIGYVAGIENMIEYNNTHTNSKIEKYQFDIPQNLTEIFL